MNKLITTALLAASFSAAAQVSHDVERLRISTERAALEAGFSREDAACYQIFLVNNCLEKVNVRKRTAMADLRRQEISINDEERKAKAAEQIQKTEDKAPPEKQQQDADRRADALRDFDARVARDRQKAADRLKLESSEKTNRDLAVARAKGAEDKQTGRTVKQAAAAEEVKKYNERVKKAKERQERIAKEKASQTNPPASPLPAAP